VTVAPFEVKGSGNPDLKSIGRDLCYGSCRLTFCQSTQLRRCNADEWAWGVKLSYAVVEALWAAYEGAAEFVETQDAIGVFCDSDADAFADWAGLADG
jgi:hypothetical protein